MKARVSILIGAVALITLSFTFATTGSASSQNQIMDGYSADSAPVGGFVADKMVK